MQSQQARTADLWTGLFWIIFGGAIAAHASTMPIPQHLGATTLTGPGLVPGLLGGALVLLGAVLAIRALRGQAIVGPDAPSDPSEVSNGRALSALALITLYAASIATRQPFVVCTVIFITVFVAVFNWRERALADRVKTLLGAAALGLAVAFALEFVFESIFYVRLP